MLTKVSTLLLLAPVFAYAQLPLSIEELLVDQDVLKLETSFSYATSTQTVQHLELVSIEQSGEQFPAAITRVAQRDNDASQIIAGLRYGVGPRTELNIRAGYTYFTGTEPPVNGLVSAFDDSSDLQTLTLGASWLASPENNTPALLLSMSLDAVENGSGGDTENLYAKTGRVGITAYTSLDPVVLSIAIGYELSSPRDLGQQTLNPGDEFYVFPQLNFAVNHKVTLIGGIGLRSRQGDEIDGRRVTSRKTSTQALVGMGFAPATGTTVFIQSRYTTGGSRSANISLDWLYQF